MQSWIEILSDPNHWIADAIMNLVLEAPLVWLIYKVFSLVKSKRK